MKCVFTKDKARFEGTEPEDAANTIVVELTVRRFFEGNSLAPSADLIKPGEIADAWPLLTLGKRDYRECACYYWAASRPDFVNAEPGSDGLTHGDSWMSKERTGEYIPDDRVDGRLHNYDDLFREWQTLLKFQVKGRDADHL